ncbi:hypothetical protein CW714_04870, partial [Methanophagales archaeon]
CGYRFHVFLSPVPKNQYDEESKYFAELSEGREIEKKRLFIEKKIGFTREEISFTKTFRVFGYRIYPFGYYGWFQS